MIEQFNMHKLCGLVHLGLWDSAEFYGTGRYNDFQIDKHNNELLFSCHVQGRIARWHALLWVYE